ncbi:unnamed protein product [Auanema sp. JU1783]|nr:unnamed protein product [Auanema sp. JU1783]
MSCCCCPVTLIVAAGIAFFLYKKFTKKPAQLRETNWKKDVVYLYQFPQVKTARNLSPFCLKIETFLRINKISYELRDTVLARSEHGLLPFIELNGEHIADSKIIEQRLIAHFDVKPVGTEQDEAVGHLISRAFDLHTFFLFIHFKIAEPEKMIALLSGFGLPKILLPVLVPIAACLFKRKANKKVSGALGGLYSESDFKSQLKLDLQALDTVLSDKKYLGGDKISTHDCGVFGQLTTVYYPFDNYCKDAIDEFPRLVKYMENIREEVFPRDFTL